MDYSFYQIAFIFLIYAVIGWISEEIFALVKRGQLVNRGFLKGPICPIYGFGVVIIVLVLTPVADFLPLLFIGSVLLTTLLELVTGYVLEKFFRTKWWDYSDCHFNFHGYICLSFSLLWGLACVLVVDVAHPLIMKLVDKIPTKVGWWILAVAALLLAVDLGTTLMSMISLSKALASFEALQDSIREKAAELSLKGEAIAAEISEKGEEAAAQISLQLKEAAAEREEKRAEKAAQLEMLREKAVLLSGEVRHRYNRFFNAFPSFENGGRYRKFKASLDEYRIKNTKK